MNLQNLKTCSVSKKPYRVQDQQISKKLTKSTIQHLNKIKVLTQKMKRKQKQQFTTIYVGSCSISS